MVGSVVALFPTLFNSIPNKTDTPTSGSTRVSSSYLERAGIEGEVGIWEEEVGRGGGRGGRVGGGGGEWERKRWGGEEQEVGMGGM